MVPSIDSIPYCVTYSVSYLFTTRQFLNNVSGALVLFAQARLFLKLISNGLSLAHPRMLLF